MPYGEKKPGILTLWWEEAHPDEHQVNYFWIWKYSQLRTTLLHQSHNFSQENTLPILWGVFSWSVPPPLTKFCSSWPICSSFAVKCGSYTSFSWHSSCGSHSIASVAASTLKRGRKGHIHPQKIMEIEKFGFLSFRKLKHWGRLQLINTFCLKP